MRKILFLFLPVIVNAQTIIPWAAQQPVWVFPLYFEDAIGQRDTVYLGYDPDAHFTQWPFNIDSIFGEYIFFQDTSVFHATAKSFLPDSIFKVDVTLLNPGTGKLYYNVAFINFHLPLKIKWDKTQFYSNSLPFQSQAPSPTAQAVFWMGSLYSEDFNCGGTQPILITDTSEYECSYSDSLILDWQFAWDPGSNGLNIIIEPWTGHAPVNIIELVKESIKIYPNPATTQITITGYTPAYLKLCNTLGQTVAEATNTTTLLLGSLPQGLYVLQVFDAKGGLVKAEKVVKE